MARVLCREYWEAHGGKDDSAAPGEKPHRSNKERTVIVDGYQVRGMWVWVRVVLC